MCRWSTGNRRRSHLRMPPYGSLEVRKYSDTGMALSGAVIQIQHIESGATYTEETGSAGVAIFNEIQPGAYRITEIESPDGYIKRRDGLHPDGCCR